MSTVPGGLENTKGKEPKKDKYVGGTIFCDHSSGFIYVHNQVTSRAGDTLRSKIQFEKFARSCGVRLKSVRTDNFPFASHAITEHLSECGQEIDYSGVGVGKIKSLTSNSNLKSNLDRTCFEISNLKMYAHNDENTNCVFGK